MFARALARARFAVPARHPEQLSKIIGPAAAPARRNVVREALQPILVRRVRRLKTSAGGALAPRGARALALASRLRARFGPRAGGAEGASRPRFRGGGLAPAYRATATRLLAKVSRGRARLELARPRFLRGGPATSRLRLRLGTRVAAAAADRLGKRAEKRREAARTLAGVWRDYGWTAVATHFGVYWATLAGLTTAVDFGCTLLR